MHLHVYLCAEQKEKHRYTDYAKENYRCRTWTLVQEFYLLSYCTVLDILYKKVLITASDNIHMFSRSKTH